MSAMRELKRASEFMQLHTSRQNCRKVQAAVKKSLQVFKYRVTPVAPVAMPLFAGVSLHDWMLAAKARREMHQRNSQAEQRREKMEAAKKQAQAAQQRRINSQQWMG